MTAPVNEFALREAVLDDRERGIFKVDRRVFTTPQLLELERERIFDRCWLYAGHESELPQPGDYIARKVGGRPLLIARDPDGVLSAFFNACPHRGNLVVRDRCGNARAFTCFYHAWTFDTRGGLIGVPDEESYTPAFERGAHGLARVPRFESYRGLMFVCFDPDAVGLREYLGEEAREQIDHIIDSVPADVEIVQGTQSYSMGANWKLLVENSIDSYHGVPTHQRFFRKYLHDIGVQSNVSVLSSDESAGRSLGNGHAVTEKPQHKTTLLAVAAEELAEQRRRVEASLGSERARRAADFDRNVFIFPNLILISTWRTVRTFYPVSHDYMEVDAWALMPKGESSALRAMRYQNFISFLGPAGFGTPDDVNALEGCQRGFAAGNGARWSDISRGMGRPRPKATDELQMRAFWRRWHALVQGQAGPTDCSDKVPATARPALTAEVRS
ncbi:MAG TPA: aromatic ring-hydroxylating dioxygenase subunit alpha [Burkholderiaceae bacterium]|nr:aromatic ring-hydroxylating dioxygenase subunit alpha [Burkholderiaceae bacterium]